MTLYLSILLYSCVSSINILVDYLGFLWRHNVSWDNNCLRTGTVSFLPFQSACLLLLLLLLFLFFFSSFSSSFFFTLLLWLELPVQCWLCKSGVISFLNIGHKFLVNLLILEGLFYFILFFWQPFFFFFSSLPKDMHIDLRERGREGERGRETLMWERNINRLPLIYELWPGTKLHPSHVPWLGIEPATFWFMV